METKQRVKRVYRRKTKEVEKMEDIPEVPETKPEDAKPLNNNILIIKDTHNLIFNSDFPDLSNLIKLI